MIILFLLAVAFTIWATFKVYPYYVSLGAWMFASVTNAGKFLAFGIVASALIRVAS